MPKTRYHTEYPRSGLRDAADIPNQQDQQEIARKVAQFEAARRNMPLVKRAETYRCLVWKAGVGIVRDGNWSLRPAQVMARKA